MSKLPLIGITMGDPAGIGPEIILKSLSETLNTNIRSRAHLIVIGSYAVMLETLRSLQTQYTLKKVSTLRNDYEARDIIYVLDPLQNPLPKTVPGQLAKENGHAQIVFIREAVKFAMNGTLDAIVTAPITKSAMYMAGYNYPGHTELLAELTGCTSSGTDSGMMIIGGPLRIMFVTTHVPLSSLSSLIKYRDVMKAIRLAHKSSQQYFGIPTPRIGVAGLNPHAGENGQFGKEEIEVITPAIERSQATGINCEGPFPADTIFQQAAKGKFDIVVAMYHDQGLIPLKLLSFGKAVNITVGLPILRTSVDHGTAYDIAGQGIANSESITEAITTTIKILNYQSSLSTK